MVDEKRMKVSLEDYKLLQDAKAKETKRQKEQVERDRVKLLRHAYLRIKLMEREIAFKKNELTNKEVLEKHPDFVSEKKPLFFIENDIDQLKVEIEDVKEQIKDLEDMQKGNVNRDEKSV